MTTLIVDQASGKLRTSQNLAGLYNHARRVARREGLPLSCSVESVSLESPQVPGRAALVRVIYAVRPGSKNQRDTGTSHFSDITIARAWSESFARKRGGEFVDMTLTTSQPAIPPGDTP